MEWLLYSFIFGIALAMDYLALSITDGLVYQDLDKKEGVIYCDGLWPWARIVSSLGFLLGKTFSRERLINMTTGLALAFFCSSVAKCYLKEFVGWSSRETGNKEFFLFRGVTSRRG